MSSGAHRFFECSLTEGERLLPLDERIAAAVTAMAREVGLADNGPILKGAIDHELSNTTGKWVFDDLARNGIQVEGKQILDLGAGLGSVSVEAVARNATPVAVEPGPGWKEILSDRLHSVGRGSMVDAVGERLPFADATFDLVLSAQVLEHVEDPEAYLREAFRVLRPGGYLWLSCENYLSFRENHYRVAWFPLLPKWLGALYLRLRGRPTAFLWQSVTYTTAPWVTQMLRRCRFVFFEELRLRKKVAESSAAKFRLARSLLRPDAAARWIMRLKRARRLFRSGICVIAQRPQTG